MRGRKPKPLAQREAEGDARKWGARKLRERITAEPKATSGLPTCPRHLRGRARAAWNFWREELAGMGLDKRPDAMMLEGACVNYARAVQADLILQRDGITAEEAVLNDAGERVVLKIRKHPAVEISNAAWVRLRAFCSEFGLSPVSRTRLAIDRKPAGQEDDLAKLLAAPRPAKPSTVVQ